jgi:hypothetical protein
MITVLLMNYQRRANLDLILESIRAQDIEIEVFLWNNADKPFQDDRVDWVINSNRNTRCWSRWFIAQYATNDFVMTMDDDLLFEGKDSFSKLYHEAKGNYIDGRIMGLFGVQYNGAEDYWPNPNQRKLNKYGLTTINKHIESPTQNISVDIVKGRCMVFNKKDLIQLPLAPKYIDFGDDIMASYYFSAGKKRHHLITDVLNGNFVNLPDEKGEMALSSKGGWNKTRSEIMNHYFKAN